MNIEQWQILAKVLWIIVLAGTLLLEGVSLGRGAGSLTSNVGVLTAIWLGRGVVGGTLVWLFWHWIIDRHPGLGPGDLVAVVVGAAIAILMGRHRDQP